MSQYRAYFVPGMVDPSGTTKCDYHCCGFTGSRNGGQSELFSESVKSDGVSAASTCTAHATANGWGLSLAKEGPCEGDGCNIGQKKNVKAVGVAFANFLQKNPPKDGSISGNLAVWTAALAAGGAATGPSGAITNTAGDTGGSQIEQTLQFLNDAKKNQVGPKVLWILVEGDCCQEGTSFNWGSEYNEYGKHVYRYNCGVQIQKGGINAYITSGKAAACQKNALAAFSCNKKDNVKPITPADLR